VLRTMLKISCSGMGISKLNSSSEWIWGLAVDKPAPRKLEDHQGLIKFANDLQATGFQFDLPEESVERFFNLRVDEDSASEFLAAYGVFRNQDLRTQRDFPKHIRKFWSSAEREKMTPFALRLADFRSEQDFFKGFINVGGLLSAAEGSRAARIAKIKDADACARALILEDSIPKESIGRGAPGAMSRLALSGPFSDKLDDAAIRLEFREGAVLPSIFTQYALPGLYAHVWRSFLNHRPWAPCAKCGKLFVVTRPGKTHCSAGCKNAGKQQRYRDRQRVGRQL
jgi:hypothetical protein